MNQDKIMQECLEVFNKKGFRTIEYSADLMPNAFRFVTEYNEDEDIHGTIDIGRKEISIATSAKYRDIKDTNLFIKQLQEAIECCEKIKLLIE